MKHSISGRSFKGLQLSVRMTFYDATEQNRIASCPIWKTKPFIFSRIIDTYYLGNKNMLAFEMQAIFPKTKVTYL